MKKFAGFLCVAWISLAVARADVLYVDPKGNGHFTDLQAAIDGSQPGDVLLVRSGSYAGFVIDNRSLTIVADAGALVEVTSTVTIRNTAASASVVLAGLTLDGAVVYPTSPPGLVLDNNPGHVRFQRCIIRGGMGASNPVWGGDGGAGAMITNSTRVAFATCTLAGGDGYGIPLFVAEGGDGGHGTVTQGSVVAFYDCWIGGGIGGEADYAYSGYEGGDGGDGCQVLDFGIVASGCAFVGGAGGGVAQYPGDGGDGLVVQSAQAQLIDNTYAGGPGGVSYYFYTKGLNGQPQSGPGVFKHHPGAARTLSTVVLAAEKQTITIDVTGEPGDNIWLYSVTAPNFLYVPALTGILLVPLPPIALKRPAAVLGPSATATINVKMPEIAGTDAIPRFLQGLAVQPGGTARLTSPAHVVVLNCSDLLPDCNSNSECDSCDLLLGVSPDCDKDGEPDECEPDCNVNGVPDTCDILNGTSLDLNHNDIPDECEAQATWYVSASAPPGGNGTIGSPFQTIRAGVEIALPGDTVLVSNGTYTGPDNRNLELGGKDIVLMSSVGAAGCIVDLQQADRFIHVYQGETNAARIEGFTFRNGKAVPAGAIWVTDGSTVTIARCIFEDCQATGGGGAIAIMQQSFSPAQLPVIVDGCLFRRCTASQNGGAVLVDAHFSPEAAVIRNCKFELNVAGGFGGGLRTRLSNTKISHCIFSDNQAHYGGGAALQEYGENYLDNCLFEGNTATKYGGALFSSGTDSFTNLTVTGNHAGMATGAGGGIYFGWVALGSYNSSLSLGNSILWHNTSTSGNGKELAIHNAAVTMQVERCDVEGGQAGVYVQGGTLTWGPGNISADPLFQSPGTDHRLMAGSPAIDAASNALVPPDRTDIDGDGNTTEPVPLDLFLFPRFVEDPGAPNTGSGTPPIVDMGAHERQ